MGYVLKLCGWYPSRVDGFSGDFVQRHALAIATQKKVIVLFAQKDPSMQAGAPTELVHTQRDNLFEYIFYYPEQRIFDKIYSQRAYIQVIKYFLPQLIEQHGLPDIIHLNVLWKTVSWVDHLSKKLPFVPIVATEHSTEYLSGAPNHISTQGYFRIHLLKKAVRRLSLWLPVSENLGHSLLNFFGPKAMKSVPNAVDTSLFYPETNQHSEKVPFRLLHISTMGYQKNIVGIANVAKKLAASGLNFQLVMIGPASKETMKLFESSGELSDRITFTGNISYQEVAYQLRKADGLFLFSRFENLPCVILEALCCGVPVISSNVGGISEVVNESNGVLIESEDEPALLKALTSLIQKDKQYNKEHIAANAKAMFSYEKVGELFQEQYGRVLNQHKGC